MAEAVPHLLPHWPVVKAALEAVERWMALKARMPGASVVVVLAVGRSPAASEVTVAAVAASVVLASVEPVEYRTVAGCYTVYHSFAHSWSAVLVVASPAVPRRSGSCCWWCSASR